MERFTRLRDVLKQTMSDKEVEAFFAYQLSSNDIEFLKETASYVFSKISYKEFNCAAMNALWVALIQDHSTIPAAPVCGSLSFGKKFIFKCLSQIQTPKVSMTKAELWDGHCWLELGAMIADISIGRTLAKDKNVDPQFKETWYNTFDSKGGLVIADTQVFNSCKIYYIPQYIMPTHLITGLIAGSFTE